MRLHFVPLLLLAGCSSAQAQDPQIAFRQCLLEQARALNSKDYPSYAVAKEFAENCRQELKSLPAAQQRQITPDYTCAVSGFAPPCPPIVD